MEINKGLFLDELDIFIIRKFFESYKNGNGTTTWDIAKEFVADRVNPRNKKGLYGNFKLEVDDTYRKIVRKIKKYESFNILRIVDDANDKGVFQLDFDTVTIAKHKFSDGYHDCMLIRI